MSETNKLGGRRALITGASRGIGAAIALAFADEGCDIAFCHLGDGEKAAEVKRAIEDRGRTSFVADCDVSDEVAVPVMVAGARYQRFRTPVSTVVIPTI
jgi:3-oxoacyl-[acyl-carrier protein] reductase